MTLVKVAKWTLFGGGGREPLQWGLAVVGETVLRKDERRFIANNQSEGYWRTLLEEISGVGGVLAKSTLIGFLLKAGQSGQ